MPKYFFDLKQGRRLEPDTIGVELKDLREAEHEALVSLGEFLREHLQAHLIDNLVLDVRDDSGNHVIRTSVSVQHRVIRRD